MYGLYLNNCSNNVFSTRYFWSSDACFCRYFWNLLILDACLFMSFTVSCIVCGVMLISNMGMESVLGGGVGLVLVPGCEDSASAKMLVVPGATREENLASRVHNLWDTKSPILKISPFLS